MKNLLIILLTTLSLFISALSRADTVSVEQELTFYTEIYPPANFIVDGELKGITIDTLKAIWKKLDEPEQYINIVPWARGYRYLLDKPNHVLFTMSKTPPRENLFKWVGPVFSSTHVLMAKKSRKYKFDNLNQVFRYKIAAVRDDISEISLNQLGFPAHNLAKVSKLEQAYKMLNSDRVDMIVATIHAFEYLTKRLNYDSSLYEKVWVVNKYENHIAFNKDTPDDIITKYQQALNSIPKEHLAIKKRYALSKEEY